VWGGRQWLQTKNKTKILFTIPYPQYRWFPIISIWKLLRGQ